MTGANSSPLALTIITAASLEVFKAYAADAPNWSGTPLIGGNVGGGKAERGKPTPPHPISP